MNEIDQAGTPTEARLSIRDVYTEIGMNYRYFLTWRQRIFAAYLAVLSALSAGVVWLLKNAPQWVWLPTAAGLVLTVVFWIIERRIRELYRACVKRGAACEASLGDVGVYSRLRQRPRWLTQSNALDLLFAGAALAFVGTGVLRLLPYLLR